MVNQYLGVSSFDESEYRKSRSSYNKCGTNYEELMVLL